MTPHWARPDHHPLPTGTRFDGAGHDGSSLNRRPKQSTAPAGLWAPAPEVVAEKAVAPKRQQKTRISQGRPSRAKASKPRKLEPCGTEAAYRRHLAYKTATCEPCRQAHAEFTRSRNARLPRKQYVRAACGTEAGHFQHRTRKERICDPCREAHNAAQRARRELRVTKAGREYQPRQAVAACGTASGYKRHKRNGEDACGPCMEAKRADNRYWQTTRKKAA